jgi:aquaporin NIP
MRNKLLAEFIGTFSLVFAGTGAIVADTVFGGVVTHIGIAIVFGLTVMTMIYAVGDISGAHFNPAVTFAFWVVGRFPRREVVPFIFSQICGALLGSTVIWLVFPQQTNLGATIPSIPPMQAFIVEIILAFTLMFVIIHVSTGAKEKGLMAGAAIGSTVGLEAIFAGPLTGASMNPARSLAPAIYSNQLHSLWIYLIAPFIGAALGAFSCKLLRGPECCVTESTCEPA